VTKAYRPGPKVRFTPYAVGARADGFPEYLQRAEQAGVDRLFPYWLVNAGSPFTAHHGLVAGLLKEVGHYTRTAPLPGST
jgi:hypothetical protein